MKEFEAMQRAWEHWADDKGKVRCLETGVELSFSPYHCAHILSKGAFPAFRNLIENMIPLSAESHNQLDGGSKRSMAIWLLIEDRIMILKRMYKEMMDAPNKYLIMEKIVEEGIYDINAY